MAKRLLLIVAILLAGAVLPRPAAAVSLKEEIDLGDKIDAQIVKNNQLYSDEAAQKEMETYGQKLAKYVKRPEIHYHFRILKDNDFNAFSIPGGYVYFTDRLWRVLRKDERIGVIGHEITHVDQRHAIDAMLKQQKRQTILAVLLAATRASNIIGNVAGMGEQIYTLKYSRGDEQQADYGSVNLCQKAGYNPAGIMLSMYKIKRFETESGGAPPKIFSDHPPTKERLQYLTQLLTSKGIAVPHENIETVATPNRIGDVVTTGADSVTFTSSKALKPGDIVWVMRDGWDFYYEKRSVVPAARAVVTSAGQSPSARIWLITSTKTQQIAKGMGVYAPPLPEPAKGAGSLVPISRQAAIGKLQLSAPPDPFERLVAVQAVWNKDNTKLVNENAGYLVVTNPSNETGYVGAQNPKYSYAPMESGSVLVKVKDPDEKRWIGPIISIGRGGGTVEVTTNTKLDQSKTYDVLSPAWDPELAYAKRVIGRARPASSSGKIVLKITEFVGGWSVADIQNGFDVYEQAPEAK
jgi:hypothetical protein